MSKKLTMGSIVKLIKTITTGGGAAGFLDTDLVSTYIDVVRELNTVRNLFRVVPMKAKTRTIPKLSTATKVYYQATEGGQGQETSFTSTQLTLTAKKLMSWIEISEETFEDSVGDMKSVIMNMFAQGMADGEEEAFLVGDVDYPNLTATEGSATSTVWFNKDVKLAFDGILTIGIESGTRQVAAGDMTVDIAREMIYRLGRYGKRSKDLILYLNPWSSNQLLGDSKLITVDKYGANATVLTGEIGKLFNQIRTFQSDYIPDTKGVMVNRNNVIIGDRRRVKIADDVVVKNDTVLWAITERVALEVEYDAGVIAVTRLTAPTAS